MRRLSNRLPFSPNRISQEIQHRDKPAPTPAGGTPTRLARRDSDSDSDWQSVSRPPSPAAGPRQTHQNNANDWEIVTDTPSQSNPTALRRNQYIVGELDQKYFDNNRPLTPTGRHEQTPFENVYLQRYIDNKPIATQDLAISRAKYDMLNQSPESHGLKQQASNLPPGHRVDDLPDPSAPMSFAFPSPSWEFAKLPSRQAQMDAVSGTNINNNGSPGSGAPRGILIDNPRLNQQAHRPVETENDGALQDIHVSRVDSRTDLREGAAIKGHELSHALNYTGGTTLPNRSDEENRAMELESRLRNSFGVDTPHVIHTGRVTESDDLNVNISPEARTRYLDGFYYGNN